jgi:hypothetical protein
MAHISSIAAAMFSDLSVVAKPHDQSTFNLETLIKEISSGPLTSTGAGLSTAGKLVATGGLFQTENSEATTGGFIRITNIKEFPAIGTPANVVKVPQYGAKTSKQIQGQADSPTMELTLNFVPEMWKDNKLAYTTGNSSSIMIGDGNVYLFRFTLLAQEPEGYKAITDTASTDDDSIGGGGLTSAVIGSVKNSSYYFLGKFEALEVTPSLTDAMSAKLTITVQSDIRGAFTVGL